MKKMTVLGCLALALLLSSCVSKVSGKGPNKNIEYATWMGLSIQSAIYGDGFIPSNSK